MILIILFILIYDAAILNLNFLCKVFIIFDLWSINPRRRSIVTMNLSLFSENWINFITHYSIKWQNILLAALILINRIIIAYFFLHIVGLVLCFNYVFVIYTENLLIFHIIIPSLIKFGIRFNNLLRDIFLNCSMH